MTSREQAVEVMAEFSRPHCEFWAPPLECGPKKCWATPCFCIQRAIAALDALLAHPDDLIALLVERGALEQAGWEFPDGALLRHYTRDDNASHGKGVPVYRQVREEGRDAV